jgi:hypothetical protein
VDLPEFLLARVSELEAVARAASDGRWYVERREPGVLTDETRSDVLTAGTTAYSMFVAYDEAFGACSTVDAEHIARWSPARVLAWCAALRAIVELHAGVHECVAWRWQDAEEIAEGEPPRTRTVYVREGFEHADDPTLLLWAQVFADHPGFRPEWRV